jgi:AcrR family transcriptional regulator
MVFDQSFRKMTFRSERRRSRRRDVRAAQAEFRRTEIFRSLGRVLQERGIAGITMGEIAERLGMTKGSLYYYFRDKDDLLYQCHMRCMAVSLQALRDERLAALPADARLREVLVAHIRGITEEVYGAVVLTDLESLSPRRRRRYIAQRDTFERGVREIIEDGIRAGVFRKVDVKIAGLAILGAINWISKWYDPDGPLGSRELAERFADFLVGGLLAEGRPS